MRRWLTGAALAALLVVAPRASAQAASALRTGRAVAELPAISDAEWGALVKSLSEQGGYFDTDNLISNERTYLEVIGPLRKMRGGAYLGVGPDQSFSYLAAARPAIAFIVDIRRDNLLQHVLLRGLFALSSNRAEYLSRLHGRALPANPRAWDGRPLEQILAHVDSLPVDRAEVAATRAALDSIARKLPIGLTDADLATIHKFHQQFIDNGTALRFQTLGRAPRPGYPTFRQLLLETDASGKQASFMADEEGYRWVKELERKNLVVPVVGDLAGPHAIRAIGDWLGQKGIGVTEYYTSNVEDYVWQDRKYAEFVADVRALPWAPSGVIIRSFFFDGRGGSPPGLHPRPGSYSAQLLQPIETFLKAADEALKGRLSYAQLITTGMLDLR